MRRAIFKVLIVALMLAIGATASTKEYFTEDELDLVRDAQELGLRVAVYINLAERRLIILGVAEKSEKQQEKERKAQEQYDKEKKKAGPAKGPAIKPPVDDLAYLHDFTRSELIRGYIEALDEIMSNIDDNYDRKLDVRGAVEDLEKFSRETLPLLEKFEPKTDAEKAALRDAIDKAKDTNASAKDALKKVPKTEQKKKPPR